MSVNFYKRYLSDFLELSKTSFLVEEELAKIKNAILHSANLAKKTLIFGNGGSAAIASHFAVDLSKNGKVRTLCFNEPSLITCLSNDYGYENWVSKCIEYHADEGDSIILISSSGKSKNMLNGAAAAREKKVHKLITFTGFEENNPLSNVGDINVWVNSKAYNFVENIHQIQLLAIVDSIIGTEFYDAS